ncbi:MAG: Ig-like domain-containing protein, partial [Cytophagaceae bacterium]|nr:Ig-like domain-containing protein [Gemmatimonadaceae bacterium]
VTIATVSGAGLVTGVKAGTVSITASASGKSAAISLAVTAPSVASVSLTPGARTVDAGTTLLIEARPVDASGSPVAATVTWTVSNPAVAVITASANNVASVEFTTSGTANVTATVDGKVAAVAITAVPRRPRFAYVYVHDSVATPPPQPFDTTDQAHNSAGGQVIVQRQQAGSWRVIFTGLRLDVFTEPMLPLVRPIGVSGGQCGITSRFTGQYSPTYGDVFAVEVACTGPGGGALTRPFMLVALGSNYTTAPWAYTEVTDSSSAALGNTYVPGGGAATAVRQPTDIYRVLLSPVQSGNDVWHPLSLSPRLTCGTVALVGSLLNRGADVDCTLSSGARSRSRTGLFVLLNGRAGQPRADAVVSEAGVVTATPSTTAPTVIKAPGLGIYRVRIAPPGLGTTRYPAVIVTALRSAAAPSVGCRVIHLTTPVNGTVEVRVECRDGNAALRDNAFAVSAIY